MTTFEIQIKMDQLLQEIDAHLKKQKGLTVLEQLLIIHRDINPIYTELGFLYAKYMIPESYREI